jgi:hypothetical protein
MSCVEELSDDFDKSINMNSPSASSPQGPDLFSKANQVPFPGLKPKYSKEENSTTPELPPAMASIKSHSTDEVARLLNKTPLFMTELDEEGVDGGENVELEALKALAYEGSPAEVALGFKEHGNECFKENGWTDSKQFYTRALAVLSDAMRKRKVGEKIDGLEEDGEEEVRKERSIEEVCLVNRAACHLELGIIPFPF